MIETAIPGVCLRFAQAGDSKQILEFIKSLAAYERMSDEVLATEETIKKTLFGDKAYAEVIFAELDGKAVGFALFFHNYSTFVSRPGLYLEDIYIYPEYRGRGIGKMMMTYLAKLAVERDCGRFEWSCLKWNKPSLDFYDSLGSETMDEWVTLRISGKKLRALAGLFNPQEV
ncbi:MAG: N-acetyltransferase GCN5 [Marinimicrobia bacterium 46_43]|nr:MAG: N-acetyltransferase GCN5 [Marinimicrobia bacterium 46_43]